MDIRCIDPASLEESPICPDGTEITAAGCFDQKKNTGVDYNCNVENINCMKDARPPRGTEDHDGDHEGDHGEYPYDCPPTELVCMDPTA
jgi:hypothetical protein